MEDDERRIKGVRKLGILGCMSYVKLGDPPEDYVPQKGSEEIPFTQAIRNRPERGASRS